MPDRWPSKQVLICLNHLSHTEGTHDSSSNYRRAIDTSVIWRPAYASVDYRHSYRASQRGLRQTFFFPRMVEGALSSRLQADGAGLEGFVVRGNTTPQAVEFCRLDQRCREKECDA